jgi:hypothetical protein
VSPQRAASVAEAAGRARAGLEAEAAARSAAAGAEGRRLLELTLRRAGEEMAAIEAQSLAARVASERRIAALSERPELSLSGAER